MIPGRPNKTRSCYCSSEEDLLAAVSEDGKLTVCSKADHAIEPLQEPLLDPKEAHYGTSIAKTTNIINAQIAAAFSTTATKIFLSLEQQVLYLVKATVLG